MVDGRVAAVAIDVLDVPLRPPSGSAALVVGLDRSLSQGVGTVGCMDERQFDQSDPGHVGGGDLAGACSGPGSAAGSTGSTAGPGASGAAPAGGVEVQRRVRDLTAQARVRAAAVAVETAALVDAVAALKPLEGHLGVTWRQWVAWQCGLTTAEARRICLLADKLPSLPLIDAAFRRGELSDGIVEKIARVATPANEAVVLAAAEAATAAQLEQVVRDFRTVRDGSTPPPGASADDPATMPSEASWGWDDHSRFRGSWNLRADDGAVFEAALELALSRFRRTAADIDADDDPHPTHGSAHDDIEDDDDIDDLGEDPDPDRERGADADDPDDLVVHGGRSGSADEASGGSRGSGGSDAAEPDDTVRTAPTSEPAPDPEPPPVNAIAQGTLRPGEEVGARRSDALVAFANLILAGHADDGLLPEAAQLVLHHNLTPTGHPDTTGTLHPPRCPDPPDAAHRPDAPDDPAMRDPLHSLAGAVLPGCGAIPDWLAQKLACACLTVTVVMIGGFPISEPTAVRAFNRAQRRALRARDRHCRFPGCTRTRHLHAHHTRHWHHTRRTTVADAVLLCDTHHTTVHLRGLTITLGTDHTVTVTRPDGTTLTSTACPPPDPATLAAHRHGRTDPPSDRRRTGTNEPLTLYARDTLATTWHLADLRASAADPAGDASGSAGGGTTPDGPPP